MEKGLEAKQVCEGLCSTAMMSSFEKGKHVPDTLLFEYMMERMGVSPELFSMMISKEELAYYEWRNQVRETIAYGEWEKLEQLLASSIVREKYCSNDIEQQFFLYVSAICCGINKKYHEAGAMLEKAASKTIPNMDKIVHEKILLSDMELHIVMLHLYYGVKSGDLPLDRGLKDFESLESYVYNRRMDPTKQAKSYSKLVCMGLDIFQQDMTEDLQRTICEKAIELLKESLTFYDITTLLERYIYLLKKHNCPEVNFYLKQYEVFKDILETEKMDVSFHPEQFVSSMPKYYMLHEYLSSHRINHNLTQEEVSESICEPETYSRVESGKRKPSRKNFHAMAQKLDINWCYYRGELDTADLEIFELRRRQRVANIKGRRQECLDILAEMEKRLDMTSVINIQYIKSNEYVAEYRMGRLSAEEAYMHLKQLLELTQMENRDTSRLVYYSQTELEIIGHIAQILRRMNRTEEAIVLTETVIRQMLNSRIHMKQQWNGFALILRALSGLYFEMQEYEKAIRTAKYVQNESVRRREANSIPETLDAVADCLEHIGKQYSEEYKKLYRYTYYVADFFAIDYAIRFAKKYYEENFNSEMVWY